MIQVNKVADGAYEVTVSASSNTRHHVTLSEEYYQQLTEGRETPEQLIERSFQFLLQREPNTAILSRFDLPVINRYFPEYEQVMRGRWGERN